VFKVNASPTTQVVGVLGFISTLIGVVCILGAAGLIQTRDLFASDGTTMPLIARVVHTMIQFLTLFGLASTVYVFGVISAVWDNGLFRVGVGGLAVMTAAQVLLYATTDKLISGIDEKENTEKRSKWVGSIFMPSLVVSMQLVVAIAVESGDFGVFTGAQKAVAWVELAFCVLGTLILYITTVGTKEGGLIYSLRGLNSTDLKDYVVLRTTFLVCFLTSAVLSVYKLSYILHAEEWSYGHYGDQTNTTMSYIFAIFSTVLTLGFVSGRLIGGPAGVVAPSSSDNTPLNP
jgi:hypothetical protein